MNQLSKTIELIKDIKGVGENLYFNPSIEVKLSHFNMAPFIVQGVCVSPYNHLFIMDSSFRWDSINAKEINADLIIAAIYNRLLKLQIQVA